MLLVVVFFTCSLQAGAQLRFQVYSGGYFNVTDYAGFATPPGGHQFHFLYSGRQIHVENWRVTARVNGSIRPVSGQNVSGQPFPAAKVAFRFTHDSGNSPTLVEIGAPTTPIPLVQNGETPLIPQSKAPITYQSQNEGYMQFHLFFVVDIAGGAYLDQFKNRAAYQPIVYALPITFTFYSQDGLVLGYQDVTYQIQINQNLSGSPAIEPQYGIEVLGTARDARLELSDIANYMEGASVLYTDGLKINANTGYVITARALGADMQAVSGGTATLPVEVVQLQLLPGSDPPQAGNYTGISLADQYQPLFNGPVGRERPQLFHIVYRTAGGDERLLRARSGVYTTTVLYQLIPQ